MFNQQIKVPVSIVCELTDIKESRLQKDYQSLIGDACESVPLDEISSSLIRSLSKYQILI